MTQTTTAWPPLEQVVEPIRALLDGAQRIGCLTHKDADADTLGSALAFAEVVRALGKDVVVVVPDPVPITIDYLPNFHELVGPPPIAPVDVLFTFDCPTPGRFGEKRNLVLDAPYPVVNIDHHATNESFGDINLVEPESSATGQVLHRLLTALGYAIPPAAATNLYAALFTDTGGFRHENTTEEALRLGAELVSLGANAGWVALKSYKSRTVGQLRLEALAVAQLHADLDGRFIWSVVTQEMLAETGADMQQAEGVIDSLQSIDSMQLAVLFKEVDEGRTKLSVRSRDPLDATAVCRPFGGGGHIRAAGAEVRRSLADLQPDVLAVAHRVVLDAAGEGSR